MQSGGLNGPGWGRCGCIAYCTRQLPKLSRIVWMNEAQSATDHPEYHLETQAMPIQGKCITAPGGSYDPRVKQGGPEVARKRNRRKRKREQCGPKKPRKSPLDYCLFKATPQCGEPQGVGYSPAENAWSTVENAIQHREKDQSNKHPSLMVKPYEDMAQRDKLRYEEDKRRWYFGCSQESATTSTPTTSLSQELFFQAEL
ncbi:hypothetical protein K493DRAFT_390575 [Basidiobolus meristosporus CBS 931.73]|uniref:Uncharacterized protein n=1 Tax=Basidiobolus meristosporus CBS 931.73 TaxID=1314790 RepID=A0A1Y1YSA1_9FUNG|nr:hypothetical protein K493DRAFT_390575 [Basidiobolus meristosporus CBS 931.73]|eukprot:ORY00856.1 hypothetical protein K493DRAFT_390575 [Basidiobolus meristosporus CBS 931.73]